MATEKKPRAAKTTKTTTTAKTAEKAAKPKVVRARKPKTTTPIAPEHIAERAYYLWAEGTEGDAFEHWVRAERELTPA